jgi:hypothetical protein
MGQSLPFGLEDNADLPHRTILAALKTFYHRVYLADTKQKNNNQRDIHAWRQFYFAEASGLPQHDARPQILSLRG